MSVKDLTQQMPLQPKLRITTNSTAFDEKLRIIVQANKLLVVIICSYYAICRTHAWL